MNNLTQLMTGGQQALFNNQWGVLLLLFAGVFLLVIALMSLVYGFFDPVRSRFKSGFKGEALLSHELDQLSEQLLKHHKQFVPKDKSLLQRTATRMHHAGFHAKDSIEHYYAIKVLLLVVLPLLTLISLSFVPSLKGTHLLSGVLIAAVVGYLGPSFVLDRLVSQRQKLIKRSFPDALDMIVICAEAGLGLDGAIQKVTAEITIGHPELATEFNLVLAEIRAGIDRHEALQKMVERTGIDDIRGLVSTIAQGMRFGTSVADTLRVYSEDLRDKRAHIAEEIAAKIGLKLIFPLGMCLLPAFLLLILAPMIEVFHKL